MRVLAYCANSFRGSVRKAAGVEPLLSPPSTVDNFRPEALNGHDLLYVKLHGLPGQPYWYGDGWTTALSEKQIKAADLRGTVVFAANCYLPETPMLDALLAAGARAVVAGHDTNYAASRGVHGADVLGRWFRIMLQFRVQPGRALVVAKGIIKYTSRRTAAIKDALRFEMFI